MTEDERLLSIIDDLEVILRRLMAGLYRHNDLQQIGKLTNDLSAIEDKSKKDLKG